MTDKQEAPDLNIFTVIALWLVLIGVCTAVFTKVISNQKNPNQQLNVEYSESGEPEIVLRQNSQGHYLATGQVNNEYAVFLVDTGATFVSVPEHMAAVYGLVKSGEFETVTANGISQSYYTTINSIKLGAIEVSNVPASISSGLKVDEILLGMSFLRHFDILQKSGQLFITVPQDIKT